MEQSQQKPPHVAIVPALRMGHLIPLVELTKRLVLHHDFLVTFIVTIDWSPMKAQKAILEALPNAISSIFLPLVSFDDLLEDDQMVAQIALSLTQSLPPLRDSFKVLAESTQPVAWVVDLFGIKAIDVAKEFGVSPYLFFSTTAMTLSSAFHLPAFDETSSCDFKDMTEKVKFPRCMPIKGSDFPEHIHDRKSDECKTVLHCIKQSPLTSRIMVNSFMDSEPGALKALNEGGEGKPPVYPIGSIIQSGLDHGLDKSECLIWLDIQPNGSVLYVSFFSGGTLSQEQLNELALEQPH